MVVDGRIRKANYTLNSDHTVSAIIPDFWEYAGLFINYNSYYNLICFDGLISLKIWILITVCFLEMITARKDCEGENVNNNERKNNKVDVLIVAIVVPVIVGVALVIALAVSFKPKYVFYSFFYIYFLKNHGFLLYIIL